MYLSFKFFSLTLFLPVYNCNIYKWIIYKTETRPEKPWKQHGPDHKQIKVSTKLQKLAHFKWKGDRQEITKQNKRHGRAVQTFTKDREAQPKTRHDKHHKKHKDYSLDSRKE